MRWTGTFAQAREAAAAAYVPPAGHRVIEQNIGLKAHIQRTMPIFLTLRDNEGAALVTAMLPPAGQSEREFRPIIVGRGNSDPIRSTARPSRRWPATTA
jgi:hypothetical protein